METATVESRSATGAGSATIADLLPAAVRQVRLGPGGHVPGRGRRVGHPELRRGRRSGAQPGARADRPRDPEGRQGLDPREHPPGVDLLRLRRPHRRRDRRADLPDELARGMPVRARELRRQGGDRRGRGAARQDPPGPRPLPEARARDPDDRLERRRDLDRRARRSAAPLGTDVGVGGAVALRRPPRTSARSSTRRARPARPRAA